jgi:prepilin-type N-terminal cleavage/methylation domain-containing protein
MEEALMRAHPSGSSRLRAQAGFSMIEMLMTAFILAVGILGLSMLQLMSIKASRGGRSLSTAVLVGEHVMEQVEMEGRLSYLNVSQGNGAVVSLADMATLRYVNLGDGGQLVEFFNSKGGPPTPASPDPAEQTTFYTVTTQRNAFITAASGTLSDVRVQVVFTDQLDQNATPIQRQVTLTRRIIHG